MNTFLLFDNALLTAAGGEAITFDARPDWLACLYDERAATVSPYLIDVDAAHEAGHLDRVMALVNATPVKMHVSLIDSVLTIDELVQHLRRFIMVRREGGRNATLRFADCAVLPELAIAFTPEQWAALVWPMARWHVHGYDGKLVALPGANATVSRSSTPLLLTEQQLVTLREAMFPNMVLGCLRGTRHGATLPGNAADQQRWASESYRLWRVAGNAHDVVVRWLTSAALDTNGAILQQSAVGTLLAHSDLTAVRAGLHAEIAAHRARLERIGEHQ